MFSHDTKLTDGEERATDARMGTCGCPRSSFGRAVGLARLAHHLSQSKLPHLQRTHVMSGNRRVSSRRNFGRGREETNPSFVIGGGRRENEGGLEIVHFSRNRLHLRNGQTSGIGHDSGRIPPKQIRRERIHLIQSTFLHRFVAGLAE